MAKSLTVQDELLDRARAALAAARDDAAHDRISAPEAPFWRSALFEARVAERR